MRKSRQRITYQSAGGTPPLTSTGFADDTYNTSWTITGSHNAQPSYSSTDLSRVLYYDLSADIYRLNPTIADDDSNSDYINALGGTTPTGAYTEQNGPSPGGSLS